MDKQYVVEVTGEDGLTEILRFERKEDLYDRFRDTEIDCEGFTDSLYYNGEVEHYENYRLLTGLPYQEPMYLVSYFDECRDGDLEGLFICSEAELERLNSVIIHFGEVLGKHSDVYSEDVYENCTIISHNQDAIRDLEVLMGKRTVSGINPLNYLGANDE